MMTDRAARGMPGFFRRHPCRKIPVLFFLGMLCCFPGKSFSLQAEDPQSFYNPLPEAWNSQLICRRPFWFMHLFRAGDSARSRADQQFGFYSEDIIQSFHVGKEIFDEKERPAILKKMEKIKANPVVLGEHGFVSRNGGYGKFGMSASRAFIPDRQKYEAFKKDFDGRFLGAQVAEWGDHLLKNGWKDSPPATKQDAVSRLEQFYKTGIADFAYGDIVSVLGYRLFYHHSFDWGASFCMAEVGENIPASQVEIAFIRGAARQYGKPWGIWAADCYYPKGKFSNRYYHTTAGWYGPGKELDPKFYAPEKGHTESLERRFQYVGFMSGSNVNRIECVSFGGYYKDDNRDGILERSPWADLALEMIDFGRRHSVDRGVTVTPVGVMVEWAHGWSPSGCTPHKIWGYINFQPCDRMMDEIFNMFFPWSPAHEFNLNPAFSTEKAYLVNNDFGDVVDVIAENAPPRILNSYPFLVLAGDVRVRGDLEKRLENYLENGGQVLAAATQLTHAGKALGIRTSGSLEVDGCRMNAEHGGQIEETAFVVEQIASGQGEKPVYRTAAGQPVMIAKKIGKGTLYVSLIPWMLNKKGHVMRHIGCFMEEKLKPMLPFRLTVSPDALEVIYNKNATGWVLTLVNNDGIDKLESSAPPVIDFKKTRKVKITYHGTPLAIREWLGNRSICWKQNRDQAEVQEIEVPPGEIKIVEFVCEPQPDLKK